MLNDEQLESLLTDLESDRVERKSSISDKEKICEAICAFANDLAGNKQPGVIFVGATDSGASAGLQLSDRLLLDLAAIRADGQILPIPEMVVQKRSLSIGDVAVIQVQPAIAPPVQYRGRVWIRVGPRRAIATQDEQRRLSERRRSNTLPFDHQPAAGTTLSDLDLTLFERVYLPSAVAPDVLEANGRSVEEQLTALRMIDDHKTPTVAGLLVLGKSPRDWLPGAYLQFVRLEGTEITDPIRHQAELSGPLPDLLAEVDRTLEAHVSIRTDVTGSSLEVRSPDYPLTALQQLVRNALMHRNYESSNAPVQVYWYSDRIEIHNPGGPFGRVSVENFGQPGLTDYRNPLVAEAMKVLGYVQRFGLGLALARKELERNGNGPWEYQGTTASTLLVVRRRP